MLEVHRLESKDVYSKDPEIRVHNSNFNQKILIQSIATNPCSTAVTVDFRIQGFLAIADVTHLVGQSIDYWAP